MEWVSTKDQLHPDNENLCLVFIKGVGIVIGCWNPDHGVWDDEEGDDYLCDVEDVSFWCEITIPK